jgi:hypothetical protein
MFLTGSYVSPSRPRECGKLHSLEHGTVAAAVSDATGQGASATAGKVAILAVTEKFRNTATFVF